MVVPGASLETAEESGLVPRAVTTYGRVFTGDRGDVKYTLEGSLAISVEKEPKVGSLMQAREEEAQIWAPATEKK